MKQLGSHWTDFSDIWYLSIFLKSVEKIQAIVQYDTNNSTLHKDICIFMIVSRWIILRMRRFQKKKNTCYVYYFFFFENHSVCEAMLEKTVETDDSITRCMRFECLITKDTYTKILRICNISCFSRATVVTRTRHSVTLFAVLWNNDCGHYYAAP